MKIENHYSTAIFWQCPAVMVWLSQITITNNINLCLSWNILILYQLWKLTFLGIAFLVQSNLLSELEIHHFMLLWLLWVQINGLLFRSSCFRELFFHTSLVLFLYISDILTRCMVIPSLTASIHILNASYVWMSTSFSGLITFLI